MPTTMSTSKMSTMVVTPGTPSIGARACGLLMIIGSTFASGLSLLIMLFFPFIHAETPPSGTDPNEDKIISYSAIRFHRRHTHHFSKVVHDKVHAHTRLGRFTPRRSWSMDEGHVRSLKRTRSVHEGDSSYSPIFVEFTNPFLPPSQTRPYLKLTRSSALIDAPPLSRSSTLTELAPPAKVIKFDDRHDASGARKQPMSLIKHAKSVVPLAVAAISTLKPKNVPSALNEAMDSARFTFQFKPITLEDPPPQPANFTPGGPFCESPKLNFGGMLMREIVVPDDVLDAPQRRHTESIEQDMQAEVDEYKVDRHKVVKKARKVLGMPVPTHPALCEGW